MASNLSVKVAADVVDLQTKFAVAKAEVQGLSAEMNKLARASAAGTLDSGGAAKLQQIAGDFLKAKTQAGSYAKALEEAGVSSSGFASAAGGLHVSVSQATREFRALFDELSTGRTRYTPGTLALIANRVFGLSGATLLATAGVVGLVGGLAYLAYRSTEASRALDQAATSARFFGNLTISPESIRQFASEISKASNISESSAAKIADSLGRVPGMTAQLMSALGPGISQYMRATGEDAEKAAASLAKFFEPKESAELMAKTLGVSEALIQAAEAADRSGDANAIAAQKVQLLNAALAPTRGIIASHITGLTQAVSYTADYIAALVSGHSTVELDTAIAQKNTAAIREQAAAMQQRAAALAATPVTPEQTLKTGMEVAEKENPISQQMADARDKINQMVAALRVAKSEGDQLDVSKLTASIEKAREEMRSLADEEFEKAHANLESELSAEKDAAEQKQRIAAEGFEQASKYLNQELEIARITAEGEIQVQRTTLTAKKDALAEELSAKQINAQQWLAQSRTLTEQLYELDVKQLQDELSTLASEPAEYARVYEQIRDLKAKEVADLEALNRQYQADTQKAVKEDVSAWKGAVNEIEGAESTLVSDVLSRRKSLSQALVSVSAELVEKEISDDLRAFTTKMLLGDTAEAQQKALEQGGLLYHAQVQATETAQTVAGQQGQTAAVIAGNAARNSATIAAAASSKAIAASTGAETVLGDAAKAFSGTYASVSQIPYVGWILAPAAAAAAFAAVAAYQGIASLDVGTMYVPQDMPAMLHAGEAVLPRPFADDYRSGLKGGGDEEEGGGGDTHHWNVGISALDQGSFSSYVSAPAGRSALAGALMKNLSRGWRPRSR